jgi:hypothetical protein
MEMSFIASGSRSRSSDKRTPYRVSQPKDAFIARRSARSSSASTLLKVVARAESVPAVADALDGTVATLCCST